MGFLVLLAVVACAGAVALGATGLAVAGGPAQPPNARSSHTTPTPISGGLGVAAGLGAGLALAAALRPALGPDEGAALQAVGGVVALAGVAAVLGGLDDVFEIAPPVRFVLLAVVSVGVAALAGPPEQLPLLDDVAARLPYWLALVGATLWVFTVMNAVNFIDGVNGLAGGAVGVAAAGLAACAWLAGAEAVLLGAAALVGGCAGFLYWNARPRACVFMGDAGSLFLGACFAGLGLAVINQAPSGAVYLPPLLLLPVLADVLLTLALRARRGERLSQAHRDHSYQRLIIAGHSHLSVARRMGLRSLAAAFVATLALHWGGAGVMLAAFVAGAVALSALWVMDRQAEARPAQ